MVLGEMGQATGTYLWAETPVMAGTMAMMTRIIATVSVDTRRQHQGFSSSPVSASFSHRDPSFGVFISFYRFPLS
ncbi:MAG: hypothetical protein ABGY24_15390 [bacterium]